MQYNFNLTAFNKAYNVKRGIKHVFTAENGLRCAVTLDIWSSNSQCSYLGVTCHFIDTKFNYESEAIALAYLDESHTAEYIAKRLRVILFLIKVLH